VYGDDANDPKKMMMERMDMDVQNIIDFLGCLSAQLWLCSLSIR
jgi:hypothetical protein